MANEIQRGSGRLLVGAFVSGAAIVASAAFTAQAAPRPQAPGDPGDVSSTPTAAASFTPTNPVNCADPNNTVNCATPPIDSPLVVGTAPPGSPFRD